MIQIKKLLIKNFKGIKNQIIVDFHKDGNLNQILSGPNGFGKTTIFEALELCITGKFDRIQTFKDVQLKTKGRNKPFFQNIDGENVTIKLLVEKDNSDFIITKFYDDIKSPKRTLSSKDFLPEESHGNFFTYLTREVEDFESINLNQNDRVEQSKINELFLGTELNVELNSLYYLFNYIQQEESIRFLKQREDDKGSSLAFLFNIEKEEKEQLKLNRLVENFKDQRTAINHEIQKLTAAETENQTTEYKRLFLDKEIGFDKEEPFKDLTDANALFPNYIEELNKLILFKSNFKPEDYQKSLVFDEINNHILPDENFLNQILISKIYDPSLINHLNSINKTIGRYDILLEANEGQFISKETIQEFFDEEASAKYKILENQIKAIDKDLGQIGVIISNLVESNEKVWRHYNEALSQDHLDELHCPLCSSDFDSLEALTSSYDKQLQYLKKFNQGKIDAKQKLIEKLKLFHQTIKNKIKDYFKENQRIEESIFSLIRNYPNIKEKVESIKARFLNQELGFSDDIYIKKLPTTLADFGIKRNELKLFIENTVLSQYRYDESKLQKKELYQIYFDNSKQKYDLITNDMLEYKKLYLSFTLKNLSHQRLTFLKKMLSKLETVLSKLEQMNVQAFNTIKQHKAEMIKKIKIPFFIYSGKILQNYQQGFGIFIDISQTGQRNNVVLKTGKDSDHDVVFHLSAGQMAVVSLAFCLSLNKVYNANENLKFLAIDDPIQTMDNLNVHSFIELLRNEFSDYQIILSTHDDFISRYMSYKFEKYGMNASIQNVQDLVLEQIFN